MISTAGTETERNSQLPTFPVDIFPSCQRLTDDQIGGRDLLHISKVAELQRPLSSSDTFVANRRPAPLTWQVINKDPQKMVNSGARIHLPSSTRDKWPQRIFQDLGRTGQCNPEDGPRCYNLYLTRNETVQAEKKFPLFVARCQSHHRDRRGQSRWGKSKVDFQWPDDIEGSGGWSGQCH